MIYTYYTNESGICVKGKTFETMKAFKEYAVKHPQCGLSASTVEPDLLGRAYSRHPEYNR